MFTPFCHRWSLNHLTNLPKSQERHQAITCAVAVHNPPTANKGTIFTIHFSILYTTSDIACLGHPRKKVVGFEPTVMDLQSIALPNLAILSFGAQQTPNHAPFLERRIPMEKPREIANAGIEPDRHKTVPTFGKPKHFKGVKVMKLG